MADKRGMLQRLLDRDESASPQESTEKLMAAAYATGEDADARARRRYTENSTRFGRTDVARHMAAAAETANRVGAPLANVLGVGHEVKNPDYGWAQDLRSNAEGARWGSQITPQQIEARMAETGATFDAARRELISELAVAHAGLPTADVYRGSQFLQDFPGFWRSLPGEYDTQAMPTLGAPDIRYDLLADEVPRRARQAAGMLQRLADGVRALRPSDPRQPRPVMIDPPQAPFEAENRRPLDQRVLDSMDSTIERGNAGIERIFADPRFQALSDEDKRRYLVEAENRGVRAMWRNRPDLKM